MKCAACGAEIGQMQATCAFCGALTPFGRDQQHQEQQRAAHAHAFQLHREHQQAEQKRSDATRSLKRTADASLYWGIGSIILCCLFVPGVVAIVLGMRARKMARRYDLVIPTSATLGLVFGSFSIVLGGSSVVLGIVENYKRTSSLEEIEARLEGKLESPTLEQPVACLLAKRSLLEGEYQGSKSSFDGFSCDGKLTLTGDQAVLEDLRFTRSSTRHAVRVCLKRGVRWSVSGFRKDKSCDEADDTAAAPSGS